MIQEFDNRNKDIKIWIDGELLHRDEAKVSVFDSVVQGGDAVWEGLRVYDRKIFCFDNHLNRLMESAKSMDFENIPTLEYIKDAIFSTLKANGMKDDTHILYCQSPTIFCLKEPYVIIFFSQDLMQLSFET